MNILIPIFSPPTGTWGSLTRVMALAKKFRQKGHEVAFCAAGHVKDSIEAKGFKIYEIPGCTLFGLPKWISDRLLKKPNKKLPPIREGKMLGNVWMLLTAMGYASRRQLKSIVQEEILAAKDFCADLILTEMELGACATAQITEIPFISTYASIMNRGVNGFFYNRIVKNIQHTSTSLGVPKAANLKETYFGKDVLKLIPNIPALDGTPTERPDVCYTGNLLEPIKDSNGIFIPEQDKRYVFCYFGTGSISVKQAQQVLPAAFERFDDVICIFASQYIKEPFEIGNVRFTNYVAAHELLPYCIAFMCHGGLNSITQSIEAGVPLILFPGFIFERRFNAEQAQKSGSGYLGELSDFNAQWLTAKIENIGDLAKDTKQFRDKFKKYHGVDTAYLCIINWMEKQSHKRNSKRFLY